MAAAILARLEPAAAGSILTAMAPNVRWPSSTTSAA